MAREGTSAFMSVEEAAVILGVSRTLAYKEAARGSIAGCRVLRVGRRLLVPREAFAQLIDSLSVGGEAERAPGHGKDAEPKASGSLSLVAGEERATGT